MNIKFAQKTLIEHSSDIYNSDIVQEKIVLIKDDLLHQTTTYLSTLIFRENLNTLLYESISTSESKSIPSRATINDTSHIKDNKLSGIEAIIESAL